MQKVVYCIHCDIYIYIILLNKNSNTLVEFIKVEYPVIINDFFFPTSVRDWEYCFRNAYASSTLIL